MQEIIVSADNQRLLGERIGYGSQEFPGRGRSYETYQIRLSAKAAILVEVGDIIRFWDCGQSDWTYQECDGEIIKADGRRIQLQGSRDLGIDTGHPPHLGLKMSQRLELSWEYVEGQNVKFPKLAEYIPTGEIFDIAGMTGNFATHLQNRGIEYVRENYPSWDLYAVITNCNHPTNIRLSKRVSFDPVHSPNWQQVFFYWEKKKLILKDTDEPLVLV